MHRNQLYFPEPEWFDPERWTPRKGQTIKVQLFSIQRWFKLLQENHLHGQSELVISIIAQHWKMRLKPEHRVILQTLAILRPKYGMQMRLIQRNVR
jgi:hypothetical protein